MRLAEFALHVSEPFPSGTAPRTADTTPHPPEPADLLPCRCASWAPVAATPARRAPSWERQGLRSSRPYASPRPFLARRPRPRSFHIVRIRHRLATPNAALATAAASSASVQTAPPNRPSLQCVPCRQR